MRPSRVAYALQDWIDERERDVYPAMPGYRKPRPEFGAGLKMPVRLPEQLRGEQSARERSWPTKLADVFSSTLPRLPEHQHSGHTLLGRYAVATLPLTEFLPGGALSGGDSDASVGFGKLCPLPADAAAVPPETMVPRELRRERDRRGGGK